MTDASIPSDPEGALERYLDSRDVTNATLYSHRSRLGHFTRWCREEANIDDLSELDGAAINQYRNWRRDDGDLNRVTLKTQMDTLRVFVRWCGRVGLVDDDLDTKVVSPTLRNGENERDVMLDSDIAESLLDHYDTYQYASREHVVLHLAWRTMLRRGAIRAIDLDDYHPRDEYLEIRHRPELDTPLKNQHEGERTVALKSDTVTLLNDWIDHKRPERTDDYGRDPLITTTYGRIHRNTIAVDIYAATRPCISTGECPHNRDVENCTAATDRQQASKCPSSVSPHAVRRGGITHWLSNDVPRPAVSDRANVSGDVLDKHYDRRTEREKMEQRRRYLDDI